MNENTNNDIKQFKKQDGCTCCFKPGDAFSIDEDVTVSARWDSVTRITAGDTYISNADKPDFEKKLLESAKGEDNEEVITAVETKNKDEIAEIINSTDENVEVTVIYVTKDSYRNTASEKATLCVVNTEAKDLVSTEYSRFISKKTADEAVSYEKGGLEQNSLWKTKDSYKEELEKATDIADSDNGSKALNSFMEQYGIKENK